MFRTLIKTSVLIADCPAEGIAAVDWRRSNGLPEDASNAVRIETGSDSEATFRAIAAEWPDVIDRNADVRNCYDWIPDLPGRWTKGFGCEGSFSTWQVPWGPTERHDWARVRLPASTIRGLLAHSEDAIVEAIRAWHAAYDARVVACEQRIRDNQTEYAAYQAEKARLRQDSEAKAAKLREARELLADDLATLTRTREALDTLAEFLAAVPLDALQGTVRRLADDGTHRACQAVRERIEAASPVVIFDREEEEENEDEDED